jgi:hypothetical protein
VFKSAEGHSEARIGLIRITCYSRVNLPEREAVRLRLMLELFSLYSQLERTDTFSILTYLLTPWSRVLLEKLTGWQLVKKFPTFYGTRRLITAFTSARHLSLS